MEGIIYKYTSPVGKSYIGQTVDENNRRTKFLKNDGQYGGKKIDNARKKYGPENFEYTVLVKVESDNIDELKKCLNQLEIGFIRMFNTYRNGYNSTEGGKSLMGYHPSEETRIKMRNSHLGQHSWNKGKTMGADTRRKISELKKGNKNMLGHKHSEESKQKMREANIGRTPPNKGVPMSEEQKQKIRNTKKNISEDTRKRMSQARKGKHRVYSPDGSFHFE